MAKNRSKFYTNQPVVFRYGNRKLVGKVFLIKPIGKTFIYDVLCEDGKIYEELKVDTPLNLCIDTYLTKLFYKKYDISVDMIPQMTKSRNIEDDVFLPTASEVTESEPEVEVRDYAVDYDEENPDLD